MNVFTQKVCLRKQEKIIVKIKEKEDMVSESLVGLRHPFLAEIYGVKKNEDYTVVAEEMVCGISLDGILRGKGLLIGWKNEFSEKEIAEISKVFEMEETGSVKRLLAQIIDTYTITENKK